MQQVYGNVFLNGMNVLKAVGNTWKTTNGQVIRPRTVKNAELIEKIGNDYDVSKETIRKILIQDLSKRKVSARFVEISHPMINLDKIMNVLKIADAVTFDVDSTVITEEGIDELANFCGKGEKIRELTKQAMQGDMTFQQSLSIRLGIINPSLSQVKEFLDKHKSKLTDGIKELVSTLQARGKQVFLVSGGFRCLIVPIATQLNIPLENIYANRLKFYFTGDYAGFDENQPTSRSGGKGEVIRHLKEEKGFKTVVHVGDGSTDLEASPPANAFIGFGGNVIRESVRSRAEWFVTNFNDLTKNL